MCQIHNRTDYPDIQHCDVFCPSSLLKLNISHYKIIKIIPQIYDLPLLSDPNIKENLLDDQLLAILEVLRVKKVDLKMIPTRLFELSELTQLDINGNQ